MYDGDIILVLEGIDNFHDEDSKNDSALKFWLPKFFPERIRVILTTNPKSKSKEYLKSLGCTIMTLNSDKRMVRRFLDDRTLENTAVPIGGPKHLELLKEVIEKHLENRGKVSMMFTKCVFDLFSPRIEDFEWKHIKDRLAGLVTRVDYSKLEGKIESSDLDDIDELIDYALEFYGGKLIDKKGMMDLISAICLSHKGLTEAELVKFSKLSEDDVKSVLAIFGMFFMCFKGYYMCHNEVFRRIVEKIYYPDAPRKKEMHRLLGLTFDKAPNNVRKLEEEATHFFRSEEFFSLKQSISTIENFLMLFNPITKFDLFRYWRRLEQRGYDPVIEYNKGVEQFDTQYIPEPDKLFVIILQVCRFLKEFSDFETEVTPIFRHPLIKGKVGVKLKQNKNKKTDDGAASSVEPKKKNLLSRGNSLAKIQVGKSRSQSKEVGLKKKDTNQASVSKITPHKASILLSETSRKRNRIDPLGTKEPFYKKDNELSDIDEPGDNLDEDGKKDFNYLEKIGLMKELRQFKLTKDMPTTAIEERSVEQDLNVAGKYKDIKSRFAEILEEWEDVNVDNPRGRDRFRNHFKRVIEEMYNFKRNHNSDFTEDMMVYGLEHEVYGSSFLQRHQFSELKKPELEEDKKKHEYLEKIDEIDLEIKPEKLPSFYYYKRYGVNLNQVDLDHVSMDLHVHQGGA